MVSFAVTSIGRRFTKPARKRIWMISAAPSSRWPRLSTLALMQGLLKQ
jgi:hypothetical protein